MIIEGDIMKKFVLFITMLSLFISNSTFIYASTNSQDTYWPEDKPSVISEAAIVMEASTGAILYEKNINEAYYPASITKVLTSLLAIENSSMKEIVDFSRSAVFDVDLDSSRIGIDVGEQLTMEQSIYGILLKSANEVSHAVAEHISGDVDTFAKLMNERAKELGATNSNFVNPHGLPDENHYTTAHDMALIARAAIQNDTFRKVVSTRSYTIPPTNKQVESRPLANSHRFAKNSNYYEGGIGGKTGYTTKALFTLVSFAERDGMTLITVIMRCDTSDNQYIDTTKLLDYGFNNFSLHKVSELNPDTSANISANLDANELFTKYSPLYSENNTRLSIEKDSSIVLPNNAHFSDAVADISYYDLDNIAEGPNTIGKINYTYNNHYVGSSDIIYDFSKVDDLLEGSYVPEPTAAATPVEVVEQEDNPVLSRKLVLIIAIVCILVILAIAYIIFVELPYIRRRKRYLQRKNKRRNSLDF